MNNINNTPKSTDASIQLQDSGRVWFMGAWCDRETLRATANYLGALGDTKNERAASMAGRAGKNVRTEAAALHEAAKYLMKAAGR